MSGFLDPSINRKSRLIDDAMTFTPAGVPLPSVVEISESGTCNRTCVFCPRSDPNYPDVKEFIDPKLIEKLATQLNALGFKGIFLFSGFVEPMLDKGIYDLVALVRAKLTGAKVEVTTNGDALTVERIQRLFHSGLSTLLISVYDGKADVDRFEKMCQDAGLAQGQYVLRHRYLPAEQDFGITLSNRAGTMSTAQYALPMPSAPLSAPCYYPHYTFFMDYLGDVLLCPHDWGKKLIVGNLSRQDFLDIWTSPAMTAARGQLACGDRNLKPCKDCDVKGSLMGRKHVEAWASVAEQAAFRTPAPAR